jgi:hypothetical protein
MVSKLFMRRAIVATLVVAALAASKTASAQTPPDAQATCLAQLQNCFYEAANQESFWAMWAGGLDCEVRMIACMRNVIIGK